MVVSPQHLLLTFNTYVIITMCMMCCGAGISGMQSNGFVLGCCCVDDVGVVMMVVCRITTVGHLCASFTVSHYDYTGVDHYTPRPLSHFEVAERHLLIFVAIEQVGQRGFHVLEHLKSFD